MNVGTYTPGKPNELGDFVATKGVPHDEMLLDADKMYASKDFYDPVKKRRINWGWAKVPPASTQTLPREITWNPELQILVQSPLEEQEQLRAGVIAHLKEQPLPAGSEVSLGLPEQVGNQSELMVSFKRPTVTTRLAATVMEDPDGKGYKFYVDYVPDAGALTVGVEGGANATLKMSASDTTIDMRLFVDNTFTEVYWMGGRVAMTTTTRATQAAGMSVSADKSGITLSSAKAWKVGSIWVTPDDVAATARADAFTVV